MALDPKTRHFYSPIGVDRCWDLDLRAQTPIQEATCSSTGTLRVGGVRA